MPASHSCRAWCAVRVRHIRRRDAADLVSANSYGMSSESACGNESSFKSRTASPMEAIPRSKDQIVADFFIVGMRVEWWSDGFSWHRPVQSRADSARAWGEHSAAGCRISAGDGRIKSGMGCCPQVRGKQPPPAAVWLFCPSTRWLTIGTGSLTVRLYAIFKAWTDQATSARRPGDGIR